MGCGEGLVMAVSPAWPVAAERIKDRETVGGEEWRARNGPPGGKAQRAQQSLGRTSGSAGRAGGETPGGGSLPLTPPQKGPTGLVGGSHPLPSLRLYTSGWSGEHTSCFT